MQSVVGVVDAVDGFERPRAALSTCSDDESQTARQQAVVVMQQYLMSLSEVDGAAVLLEQSWAAWELAAAAVIRGNVLGSGLCIPTECLERLIDIATGVPCTYSRGTVGDLAVVALWESLILVLAQQDASSLGTLRFAAKLAAASPVTTVRPSLQRMYIRSLEDLAVKAIPAADVKAVESIARIVDACAAAGVLRPALALGTQADKPASPWTLEALDLRNEAAIVAAMGAAVAEAGMAAGRLAEWVRHAASGPCDPQVLAMRLAQQVIDQPQSEVWVAAFRACVEVAARQGPCAGARLVAMEALTARVEALADPDPRATLTVFEQLAPCLLLRALPPWHAAGEARALTTAAAFVVESADGLRQRLLQCLGLIMRSAEPRVEDVMRRMAVEEWMRIARVTSVVSAATRVLDHALRAASSSSGKDGRTPDVVGHASTAATDEDADDDVGLVVEGDCVRMSGDAAASCSRHRLRPPVVAARPFVIAAASLLRGALPPAALHSSSPDTAAATAHRVDAEALIMRLVSPHGMLRLEALIESCGHVCQVRGPADPDWEVLTSLAIETAALILAFTAQPAERDDLASRLWATFRRAAPNEAVARAASAAWALGASRVLERENSG